MAMARRSVSTGRHRRPAPNAPAPSSRGAAARSSAPGLPAPPRPARWCARVPSASGAPRGPRRRATRAARRRHAQLVAQQRQRAAAEPPLSVLLPAFQRAQQGAGIAVALALLAVGGAVDDGAQRLGHRLCRGVGQAQDLAAVVRRIGQACAGWPGSTSFSSSARAPPVSSAVHHARRRPARRARRRHAGCCSVQRVRWWCRRGVCRPRRGPSRQATDEAGHAQLAAVVHQHQEGLQVVVRADTGLRGRRPGPAEPGWHQSAAASSARQALARAEAFGDAWLPSRGS